MAGFARHHRSRRYPASALLAALLGCAAPGCSVGGDDELGDGGGSQAERGALVYRLDSARVPFFLAGSFHLLTEDDYPLAPAYGSAYEQADQLVLELRKSEDPDEANRRFLDAGTYPPGESLRDHLPASSFKKLEGVLDGIGLSPSAVSRFRPWMVAAMVAVTQYTKLGARAELGLDRHFEGRADRDGKAVLALETIGEQIGVFASMSEEESLQMLEQTIAEASGLEENATMLMEAWRSGDEGHLADLIFEELDTYRAFFDALVFERNRKWSEKVEKLIDSGRPTLVIVGAAHLVGEGSLVDLLRGNGHTVTQVASPATAPAAPAAR